MSPGQSHFFLGERDQRPRVWGSGGNSLGLLVGGCPEHGCLLPRGLLWRMACQAQDFQGCVLFQFQLERDVETDLWLSFSVKGAFAEGTHTSPHSFILRTFIRATASYPNGVFWGRLLGGGKHRGMSPIGGLLSPQTGQIGLRSQKLKVGIQR